MGYMVMENNNSQILVNLENDLLCPLDTSSALKKLIAFILLLFSIVEITLHLHLIGYHN